VFSGTNRFNRAGRKLVRFQRVKVEMKSSGQAVSEGFLSTSEKASLREIAGRRPALESVEKEN